METGWSISGITQFRAVDGERNTLADATFAGSHDQFCSHGHVFHGQADRLEDGSLRVGSPAGVGSGNDVGQLNRVLPVPRTRLGCGGQFAGFDPALVDSVADHQVG